jgi:hypothetical protein
MEEIVKKSIIEIDVNFRKFRISEALMITYISYSGMNSLAGILKLSNLNIKSLLTELLMMLP